MEKILFFGNMSRNSEVVVNDYLKEGWKVKSVTMNRRSDFDVAVIFVLEKAHT